MVKVYCVNYVCLKIFYAQIWYLQILIIATQCFVHILNKHVLTSYEAKYIMLFIRHTRSGHTMNIKCH
jgi:hypothetical protein